VDNFLQLVPDWGPESLLALVVALLLWGKLIPKPTVDKTLADKDKQIDRILSSRETQIAELKLYYEGRIADIIAAHTERGADLRHIAEVQARALQTAVDNSQKLIKQNDELLDLARTAAPAIVAARRAAEDRNDVQ
jgi:hypothetical protein